MGKMLKGGSYVHKSAAESKADQLNAMYRGERKYWVLGPSRGYYKYHVVGRRL